MHVYNRGFTLGSRHALRQRPPRQPATQPRASERRSLDILDAIVLAFLLAPFLLV